MTSSLPILLYHGVNPRKDSINVSPERFEQHLKALQAAGYRGVGMEEAASYFLEGRALPAKSVLITFDDGYLDNWLFAYPLLKKYGHKATIFVVAGAVENGPSRPNLEDVWSGKINESGLTSLDTPCPPEKSGPVPKKNRYLNWEEARTMERDGWVHVAAHSFQHTTVFSGPEFSGYFNPEALANNLDRLPMSVPLGFPRFSSAPALSAPAFLPSQTVFDLVGRHVPQEPEAATAYFLSPDSRAPLEAAFNALPPQERGEMESRDAFRDRVRGEVDHCKALIQTELDRPEIAFCWPWGQYSATALTQAQESGYRLFFATSCGANLPGKHPEHIHRFKVRDCSAAWLLRRVALYSRPFPAKLYGRLKRQ